MRAKGIFYSVILAALGAALLTLSCDDNDSSGGLNPTERDSIVEAFEALDEDGDEGLSGEEVVEPLDTGADDMVSEDELMRFHDDFSLDGLSERDMENLRKAFEATDADVDMLVSENEIFRVMDENKDGRISREELLDFHELVSRSPRAVPEQFLMSVEDVFSIQGRGTVATGTVERGTLSVGDEVEIVGLRETIKATVTGVESPGEQTEEANPGDEVGLLLRGIDRDDVIRGQVLATPGSVDARRVFNADITLLTREEGGRSAPIFDGYRPRFALRTAELTGTVRFPEGLDVVFPGETASVGVELVSPVAVEKSLGFEIKEGGMTVGSGVITEIPADE